MNISKSGKPARPMFTTGQCAALAIMRNLATDLARRTAPDYQDTAAWPRVLF
jgi:hypothetical protein